MAWGGFAWPFVSSSHVSLFHNDDELSQRRTTSGVVYSTRKIFGELTWSVDKKLKNLFCHLFHSFSFILPLFVTIFLPGSKTGITSQCLHGLKSYFFFCIFYDDLCNRTSYLLLTVFAYLQVKNGTWLHTIIQVDTSNPNRLPVLDVAAYDIGDEKEEFGLEIGPACFYQLLFLLCFFLIEQNS